MQWGKGVSIPKCIYSHISLYGTFCPEANPKYNRIIKEKTNTSSLHLATDQGSQYCILWETKKRKMISERPVVLASSEMQLHFYILSSSWYFING
jgi:hypothetical protein